MEYCGAGEVQVILRSRYFVEPDPQKGGIDSSFTALEQISFFVLDLLHVRLCVNFVETIANNTDANAFYCPKNV